MLGPKHATTAGLPKGQLLPFKKGMEVGQSPSPMAVWKERMPPSGLERLKYSFKSIAERFLEWDYGIQVKNVRGLETLTAVKADPVAVFRNLNAAVEGMRGIFKAKGNNDQLSLTQRMEVCDCLGVDKLSGDQLMRLRDNLKTLRDGKFNATLEKLKEDHGKDAEFKERYEFGLDLLEAIEEKVLLNLGAKQELEEVKVKKEETAGIDKQLMNNLKAEALKQIERSQQNAVVRLFADASFLGALGKSDDPARIFKELTTEALRISEGLRWEGNLFLGGVATKLKDEIIELKDNPKLKSKLVQLVQSGWLRAFNELIAREKRKEDKANPLIERLLSNNKLMLEKIIIEGLEEKDITSFESSNSQAVTLLANELEAALDNLLKPVYSKRSNDPHVLNKIVNALNESLKDEKEIETIKAFGEQKFDVCKQFDKDALRIEAECVKDEKTVPLKFDPSDKSKGYEQLLEFFEYNKIKDKGDPENQAAAQRFKNLTFFANQCVDIEARNQFLANQYLGPINYKAAGESKKLTIVDSWEIEALTKGKKVFGRTAEGKYYVVVEGSRCVSQLTTSEAQNIATNSITTNIEYRLKFDYDEASQTCSLDLSESWEGVSM